VVGQPHIVTTLRNSIRRGRVAHAYLFAGPRGVGKTSISRILAKAVNCVEGMREEPCNECHTCKAVDSGGFVDVIEIDAASNRGIDEIRELRETVRYLPMEGRYKVYIIDEAHMLTEPAFNALLKTLEEPPGHNIFVLATTEPQKIPYTIMSRCQRFDFRRISEPQIIEQLKRICLDEEIEYDEKVLNYLVREADGSLRDAESLLDQVIAYSGKHVFEKDVIDVIGVVQRDVAYGIMKCVIGKDPKGGLALIARTLEEGHDVFQVYKGLVSFLRDCLMIKVWDGKPPFVFMDDEEYERVTALLGEVEYYEIQNMVHHMLESEDLVRSLFPKISLEILFINLYNLSQLRDVESMLETAPVREGRVESGPRGPEPLYPAAQADKETGTAARQGVREGEYGAGRASLAEAMGKGMEPGDLLTYLREKSKMLFAVLSSLDLRAEGDRVVVSLDKRSAFLKNDATIVGELKEHASAFFGREMAVRFVDDSGERVETIDDYVREAELLFKV